jgi:hypothetical protein
MTALNCDVRLWFIIHLFSLIRLCARYIVMYVERRRQKTNNHVLHTYNPRERKNTRFV